MELLPLVCVDGPARRPVLLHREVFLVIAKQTPRRHILIFCLDMGRWSGGGGLTLQRMGGEPISS